MKFRGLYVLFACMAAGLHVVQATPVIGTTEAWNSGTFAASGWANQPGAFGGAQAVDADAIGAQRAVRVMFGDQGAGPYSPEDEKIYATASAQGGNFLGDYTIGNLAVNFKFYADDYTTIDNNTLALYFHSSIGNRTWKFSLNSPALIDTWYDYTVPMGWGGWTSPGAGQADFNADLADVDQLGVWVYRSGDLPAQQYGIDDFGLGLFVPEPSTYAMLAFTFLTLGLTLRRKQLWSLAPALMLKRK